MKIGRHLRNYATVLAGAGVSRLFMFIASITVARALGKTVYGQFSLFYVAFSMVPLFPQSLDTTYIRYARNLAAGETKLEYLRINILLKIAYLLLIFLVSIPIFLGLSGETDLYDSRLFLYGLGALGGASLCFCYTMASHFQEQERFLNSALVEASYCLLIGLGVVAARFAGILENLGSALSIYMSVSIGMGFLYLLRLIQHTGSLFRFEAAQAKSYLALGKWVFLTTAVMYLFPRLDIITLSNYVSFADIGVYTAATSLVMMLGLFSRSLNKVVLPKAMKEAVRSPDAYGRFTLEVLVSSLVLLCISAVLFVLAEPIVRLVYGAEYSAAASILRVLLIGNFVSMLYAPHSYIYYAIAEARLRFGLECSKFILAGALLLIFIPLFGLHGAAWAITTAMISNTIWSYSILRRKITEHFDAGGQIETDDQKLHPGLRKNDDQCINRRGFPKSQ